MVAEMNFPVDYMEEYLNIEISRIQRKAMEFKIIDIEQEFPNSELLTKASERVKKLFRGEPLLTAK